MDLVIVQIGGQDKLLIVRGPLNLLLLLVDIAGVLDGYFQLLNNLVCATFTEFTPQRFT